jgi:hypothetical protein
VPGVFVNDCLIGNFFLFTERKLTYLTDAPSISCEGTGYGKSGKQIRDSLQLQLAGLMDHEYPSLKFLAVTF